MMLTENVYDNQGIKLKYYEVKNGLRPLVLLHAQGVDSLSFAEVIKTLSKKFHVYAVNCYGHGGSLHDPAQYHLAAGPFLRRADRRLYHRRDRLV